MSSSDRRRGHALGSGARTSGVRIRWRRGSTSCRRASTCSPSASRATCCAALPEAERPTAHELLPALVRRAGVGAVVRWSSTRCTSRRRAERVAWMDHVGIDHCLVNPGGYWQQVQFVPGADWPRAIERCNAYLCEQLDVRAAAPGRAGRPQRSGAARSRSSSTHAPAEPARSSSPPSTGARRRTARRAIPHLDPVWEAAVRLGMVAVIHVGNTESDFTGWADIGWRDERSAGIGGLVRLANTQRVHAGAEPDRRDALRRRVRAPPDLTVVLEEMRVNWVPPFFRPSNARRSLVRAGRLALRRVGRRHAAAQRAVDAAARASATPTRSRCSRSCPNSWCGRRTIPHLEGNAEPIELYGDALDDARRASCASGSWAATSRTASPVPATRSPA